MVDLINKNMFNLDSSIRRTAAERIAMVEHEDCPLNVLESVAQFDTDPIVLNAVLNSERCNDDIEKLIYKNSNIDFAAWLKEFKILEASKPKQVDKSHPMHKTFCSIPWIHAGTNANGTIRACCQMIFNDPLANVGLIKKDDGRLINYNDNISEHMSRQQRTQSDQNAGK